MRNQATLMSLLLTILLPACAFAAVGMQDLVHVACGTGVDQSGCGAIGSPCNSVTYASQYLDGGVDAANPDIMYIKGTCSVAGSTSYNAPTVYPRGNYCKFTTWPGQPQAFIDGGESPTGTVIGATKWGITDITLENLQINGEVVFRGITNLLITDCDLWGGGTKDPGLGAWCDVLFTEDCPNGRVQNNKIHDANGACGVGQLWTHYGKVSGDVAENFIIENNNIYVSPGMKSSHGVFLKDNPESIYVRNNFFHNLTGGVKTSNQPEMGHNVNIHNNVFSSCGSSSEETGAITLMTEVTNVNIYNNSFANSAWPDIVNKWGGVTFGAWNNLMIGTQTFIYMVYGSTINDDAYYLNYNGYYDPGTPSWYDEASFTPLASWQSHLASLSKTDVTDANSVYADPGFINASGSYSTPTDFKRSSYPANGRGGDYPSVMGAYITGDEVVGYTNQQARRLYRNVRVGEVEP